MKQEKASPAVLATTKQGTDIPGWIETSVWSERMLAALGNGVKGGKNRLLYRDWTFYPA